MRRRSNSIREAQNTEFRPDDIQVLNYITEKGGKVFEQEIRLRFTLPKTSAWRQIKRLERLGYVKVYKVGSQNQIERSEKNRMISNHFLRRFEVLRSLDLVATRLGEPASQQTL